jgi:hypothetical protein
MKDDDSPGAANRLCTPGAHGVSMVRFSNNTPGHNEHQELSKQRATANRLLPFQLWQQYGIIMA